MANPMEQARIEKVTVNIGVGESGERLGKAEQLLEKFTGRTPVRTVSSHKIPTWNIRKGEPIGCKVTLRGEKAKEIIERALYAKESILEDGHFSKDGNVSFGVQEYIDIKDLKYDPLIGIFGINITINLERPGYRIGRRSQNQVKVPKKARVTRDDALEFMKVNFGVKIEEED